MRLLLDTHALIWWWKDDALLSAAAREAMQHAANDVFVSAATALEIATKVRKGHMPELQGRLFNFERDLERDHFRSLPATLTHGLRGGALEGAHKDPFDRLIAAQALTEGMIVVTRDREIAAFGCDTLW